MTRAIDVNALTRHFGNLVAVDAVDFWVNKGEVFGFLGPRSEEHTSELQSH